MPIMDGYEACERIDEFYMNYEDRPPIYALTADPSEETAKLVARYPFACKFCQLDEGVEIIQIIRQIQIRQRKLINS